MSRPRAWSLVMLGRLVVLAIVAGAAFAAVCSSGTGARTAYRCPMHPDVVLDEPGACPICQMALVADAAPHGTTGQPPAGRRGAPLTAMAVRRAFSEPLRVPAWVSADGRVTALVFRDDLVGAAPGQPATFASASAPSTSIDVVLTDASAVPWDSATAQIQLEAASGASPGEQGTLVLPPRSRELLVVPTSAIIATPAGPCVVVVEQLALPPGAADRQAPATEPSQRHFVRRAVQIGRVHLGTTAILSGLAAGELVVVETPFFLDGAEHTP